MKSLRVFFLLFLLAATIGASAAVPAHDELLEQKKLRELQEKISANKKKLLETKIKEQNALSKLVVTKKELVQTTRDLRRANTRIAINEGEISKLTSNINVTKQRLGVRGEALKKRLREIYKNSSVNYLELLFSSSSMSDFINRSYFFSKIVGRDAQLIQGISEDYNTIKTEKTQLVKATNQVKELATEIKEKKEEISAKAEEVKQIYASLKERREAYEKQIAEMERSSNELEKIILAKIAERTKTKIQIIGSTGSIDWPLRGRITSVFGMRKNPFWRGRHMHTGLDIAAPYGETIRAADGGEVIYAGWWDGYGKAVVIDHGKKMSTVYGHMSRIYAQSGSSVKKGQIIGLVGSTGYSTGPHLHFEVRLNGRPQNPSRYLP